MSNNLPALLILRNPIMFTNFTKLYGLKQAPRAWYKCLTKFLIEKGFEIGKIDSTLFTKRVNGELFVCQIYVDDIIFGSTNPHFVKSLES